MSSKASSGSAPETRANTGPEQKTGPEQQTSSEPSLKPGDPAPDFSLLDGRGETVKLSDFRGQRVILYFYPRDNTPGCTKEACGFRDEYAGFTAENAVVLGISTDDAKKHQKFSEKYDLPFPLLCDTDAAVATAYESYGLKKFMGKEYMGILRQTFVIGPDGQIEQVYRKVKPAEHATQVLADLRDRPSTGDS